MKTRSALLAAVLSLSVVAPAPAMARERSMGDAVRQLNDPALQQTLATAMASLTQAMMGMKMAPFANAMKSMGKTMGKSMGDKDMASDMDMDMDPDATLGDMMGPEGRDMPRQLSEKVPAMMGGMAGMAGAMEQMLPQLQAIGKQLQKSLPRGH
jgi:hypothetical protein